MNITIFTDASFDPASQQGIGGYFLAPGSYLEQQVERIEKSAITNQIRLRLFENTSSTRIEVETVLRALEEYLVKFSKSQRGNLFIITDSQCISGLLQRRSKLEINNFYSKNKNKLLKNAELYKKFYELYDIQKFEVIKITGHSPKRSHDSIHRIFSFIDKEVRKTLRRKLKPK